jgi:hypothetical protein
MARTKRPPAHALGQTCRSRNTKFTAIVRAQPLNLTAAEAAGVTGELRSVPGRLVSDF